MGSVTCRKGDQEFEPSIAATSYNSCGMPCRPARKMTIMLPPMAPHRAISIKPGRAHSVQANQPDPLKPVPVSVTPSCQMPSLIPPYWDLTIQAQSYAPHTIG